MDRGEDSGPQGSCGQDAGASRPQPNVQRKQLTGWKPLHPAEPEKDPGLPLEPLPPSRLQSEAAGNKSSCRRSVHSGNSRGLWDTPSPGSDFRCY